VRIRTLARYLDAANWSTGTNPYGTPSSSTELPRQVFYLDRKVTETREIVEWECASAFDLAFGPKVPKRLITRTDFPGVGTFVA
jgi:lambda family phage minor tail protein L